MIIKNPNYEMILTEDLGDIKSDGLVLRHKKSGARIALISNLDDNKVFYIGFRTPPEDSTGVPHIIEHTVLCGSDKYPVKDPFVELAKGSLNTFLNAMTYPDKTVYPVASCNDADFKNLMDVYLDAVFHPNIYKYREIFEQEGWHYELEDPDGELTINGVVYNEMKGAFSSPDSILDREAFSSLFPDTAYGVESGGDPKHIPDLTYEEFLDFHARYYHPCNSFIYLYGDMDFEERLDYLDKEYLSKYDEIKIDSEIDFQKPFKKPIYVTKEYPISQGEDEANQTYLSYNVAIDNVLNTELTVAFAMLDYALLSSPGAPLKEALMDSGICADVTGGYDDGILQPMFSVVAKYANPEDEDKFIEIIEDTLKQQVAEGIDKKALLACANASEFRIREADFGSYPKGLIYGLNMLDSWLYHKDLPFLRMNDLEVLLKLKDQIETDYFENLIKKYLLKNNHRAYVKAVPKKGLGTMEDEALAAKLAEIKANMSPEEIKELVERTKHLKAYQEEPSSEEDLRKIPMLTRDDLTKEARPLDLEVKDIGGITTLHHNIFTSDIHYMTMCFNVDHVAMEDLQYLSFLSTILGVVDTEAYSYADFSNKINIETGGISCNLKQYEHLDNGQMHLYFEVKSKFMCANILEATNLIEEMLLHSDFTDSKRMHDLISMQKSRLESGLNSAGHLAAAVRGASQFSKSALITDKTSGIEYYRFIKNLEENYDDEYLTLQRKCIELTHSIFRRNNLLVSCTGDDRAFAQLNTYLPRLVRHLFTTNYRRSTQELVCIKRNEAFKDAAKIQYVSRSGNYKKAGFESTGALNVLKVIMAYEYLWIKVRVQGGAYGAMANFAPNGDAYFVSYRDPNLKDTIDVYEGCADYIRTCEFDDYTLTKYVIGAVSSLDTPLTPSQRGARGLNAYMVGLTDERIQNKRDEVINVTVEDIHNLAPLVEAVMEQNNLCVIGNEDKIEEAKDLFDSVSQLF